MKGANNEKAIQRSKILAFNYHLHKPK